MSDLQGKNGGNNAIGQVGDVIVKGENNPKGLIGVIALGIIAVGGYAIKAISGK